MSVAVNIRLYEYGHEQGTFVTKGKKRWNRDEKEMK
jgi:hypothetical protein